MGIPYFKDSGGTDDTEIKKMTKKTNELQTEIDILKSNNVSSHINTITSNTQGIITTNNNLATHISNISTSLTNNATNLTNHINNVTSAISTINGNISSNNTDTINNTNNISTLQANTITYSNSAHNGSTRTNKFLKATNADGSEAQWVSFNEGNNAIPQILCGQVSASSGFFSSLTGSTISCSNACNVNALSAGGNVDFTGGDMTIGKASTTVNTIQSIIRLGQDGQNSFRMYRDNNNYNSIRFRVGNNDIFNAVKFALYQFKDIRMSSGAVVIPSSDDRYKHNEVDIKNGLEMIRILNPQTYDKTAEMLDADYNGDLTDHEHRTEAGFIAQEVAKIPELAYCVHGGETPEKPYYLNYNDLFVYGIAGLKELDAKVLALEARLDAKVLALEARLAAL